MRNKTLIRILAVIALIAFTTISVITIMPFSASAQTAQQKLNSATQKKQEMKQKINETNANINKNMAQKQAIDQEINSVQQKIDKLNTSIENANTKIAAKQAELQIAEQESAEQYESYVDRAKLMVERGSVTYLEILFNAKSFSDLLSRVAVVKQIVRYDSNRLDELKAAEEKVRVLKQELEGEKAQLVTLKSDQTAQKNALETKRSESQKIINNLQNDKASYEDAYEQAEKAQQQARSEIAAAAAAAEAARQKAAAKAAQSGTPSVNTSSIVAAKGRFMWPSASSTTVTSPYYMRKHPVTGKIKQHTGIDIGAGYATNILAADSGTVIVAGYNAGGYGNYVVVSHGDGYSTLYAHCSSLCVSKGQYVTKGQVIAKVGSTGMSTGNHLHFEVLVNGQSTNPAAYFN